MSRASRVLQVGALHGRHYRTRGVNNIVSSLDVCIELEMRRMGDASRLFNRLFGDMGLPLYMFADDRASSQEAGEHGDMGGIGNAKR